MVYWTYREEPKVTIILSIAIMIAVVAALSIKVLLGREREVKRFGCGSFNPAGPAGLSALLV